MAGYRGFIFLIDEPKRAESLDEAFNSCREDFTDVLSAADFRPKTAEIFLISFDSETIEMAALVRKESRVATGKDRIRFTELVRFEPVTLARLEELLSKKTKPHFSRASSGRTVRLPPKTWLSVWEALKRERPSVADQLEHLEHLRRKKPAIISGPNAATIAHEMDAAMLALKLAGLKPSELLKRISPREGLSLFEGIKSVGLIEDQMIVHDASVFSDWGFVPDARVGEAIFRSGNRVVNVVNVNRTSIEKTLGVDLLYFVRPRSTFLMVQYKRMTKEKDELFGYRPDQQCLDEVERMWAFVREHPDRWDHSPTTFRLNAMPFFMKLCSQDTCDPTSSGLLSGMYLPLDLWKVTCDSDVSKGPRGGTRLTYENTPVYLRTTDFVSLVQTGLVGSRGTVTDDLKRLAQEKLGMDHSVVIAQVDNTEANGDDVESKNPSVAPGETDRRQTTEAQDDEIGW